MLNVFEFWLDQALERSCRSLITRLQLSTDKILCICTQGARRLDLPSTNESRCKLSTVLGSNIDKRSCKTKFCIQDRIVVSSQLGHCRGPKGACDIQSSGAHKNFIPSKACRAESLHIRFGRHKIIANHKRACCGCRRVYAIQVKEEDSISSDSGAIKVQDTTGRALEIECARWACLAGCARFSWNALGSWITGRPRNTWIALRTCWACRPRFTHRSRFSCRARFTRRPRFTRRSGFAGGSGFSCRSRFSSRSSRSLSAYRSLRLDWCLHVGQWQICKIEKHRCVLRPRHRINF